MRIEVSELEYSYGRCFKVLENVSFTLKAGEFMSVLGKNGAGKSTIFRCILGMLPEYKGQIMCDGKSIREMTQKELAEHIAYIPQIHRPTFGYTVINMVLMGLNRLISPFSMPSEEHVQMARGALKKVGIENLADRNFAHLSGGEQQLTLIARAIAQDSNVLIMDEPTSALDYGNQYRVMKHIRQLADDGYSVLMSTHNPQHAIDFADNVIALHKGTVEDKGKPNEVIDEKLIKKLYDIDARIVEVATGKVISPCIGDTAL